MTTSTAPVYGVSDADLPMSHMTVRIPIAWLKQIKTKALIRQTNASQIARELMAAGAEAEGFNLKGY